MRASWPFPPEMGYRSHWLDTFDADMLHHWKQLLFIYLGLDGLFIAVYAVALLAIIDRVCGRNEERRGVHEVKERHKNGEAPLDLPTPPPRHWVSRLVWALVIVDVVEELSWLFAEPSFESRITASPRGSRACSRSQQRRSGSSPRRSSPSLGTGTN